MVSFHEHIISELLEDENGGLVILSSGLCLHKLVSSLLSLHSPSQGSLLILSASPSQKSSIIVSLQQFHDSNRQNNADSDLISPSEITSDLPANQRQALYTSGGVMFITSRILIVDLLTSRVPTSKIAGLVILNAHALSETCTEAFIVRIIRSLNRTTYIRAFSDKPHSMVSGFSKAERIMKCLSVRKMHLWPRFQVHVSQELEKDPPEVVDVRVPMSSMMRGIQKAIIEVMDACLKEMRKTNKVDVEDLTVENGLFKSFDEIVRRQLDPIWHTLGMKTKQLVSDLRALRKLLEYLVRYDAVSYLKYLDSLRASESFRSVWIFAESSYKIFEYAKKRVFYFGKSSILASSPQGKTLTREKRKANEVSDEKIDNEGFVDTNVNGAVGLQEVLEEAPKWKVLREILQEIEEDIQKQTLLREEIGDKKSEDNNRLVLVACKDERSCLQIEDCILNGPRKVMRDEWESYLLSKVELKDLQKRQKKKQKEPKGVGVLDGVSPTKSAESTGTTSLHKLEHDMLLRAAANISKVVVKDPVVDDTSEPQINRRGGKKGNVKSKKKATLESKGTDCNGKPSVVEKSGAAVFEGIRVDNRLNPTTAEACILRKHTPMVETSNLPPVHFHALESDQHVLDILKPSVIIMYHPDITFVREIEIYRAENHALKVKVYFLFYDESTEVQKFEASIRRENGAFESLIRKKSLMMIPVDQGEHFLDSNYVDEPIDVTAQNSVTRKAGGRREIEKQTQVIVDMREFMSSLPNVLHQKGMRIIPVTLEVGDYVLSPLICVERKSIQDLFTSFGSGRLYHQVETMVRYYRIPVLLIEFTQDKSFSFFSATDIGDDVTPNSIISKLSLLVLHFPRLRIVWSRSLHATAEIFASLKSNQDEPDEVKATHVGVPTEEGVVENDIRAENYNTSAIEFLRRLPGVTDSNYRSIMEGCNSLAELALLPVDKLGQLMGGMKVARCLRDFLDAKYPTLL